MCSAIRKGASEGSRRENIFLSLFMVFDEDNTHTFGPSIHAFSRD